MPEYQSPEWHPAFEEYCETIFELREDDVDVIQARIADRMAVSRPAVSEMIRRLEGAELVKVGKSIALTDAGVRLAERVVRRHRLAERFLTDMLGLSWAEAHKEAGKWEHVISDQVEAAIMRVLHDPTTCPHGNPIPGSDYLAPETVTLAELGVGKGFVVSRIPEELEFAPGLLEFLEQSSVVPGSKGTITAASPDGTTTVEIDGNHVGIGAFAHRRGSSCRPDLLHGEGAHHALLHVGAFDRADHVAEQGVAAWRQIEHRRARVAGRERLELADVGAGRQRVLVDGAVGGTGQVGRRDVADDHHLVRVGARVGRVELDLAGRHGGRRRARSGSRAGRPPPSRWVSPGRRKGRSRRLRHRRPSRSPRCCRHRRR